MRGWFASLTLRERVLLGAVIPLALALACYQFAFVPLSAARAALQDDIAAYRLVALTAEGRAATPQPVSVGPTDPIAVRVTQSAEAAGLQLRRLAPEGSALRVTLDDVDFSQVILWLADMEATQSLRTAAIEMDRRPEPGVVSARVLLEDAR